MITMCCCMLIAVSALILIHLGILLPQGTAGGQHGIWLPPLSDKSHVIYLAMILSS